MKLPSQLGFVEGVKVVFLKDATPYYSGYAGNPQVIVKSGTIGVVGATDVPSVKRENIYFVCVDVKIPGVYQGNPENRYDLWRCGVDPKEIKVMK